MNLRQEQFIFYFFHFGNGTYIQEEFVEPADLDAKDKRLMSMTLAGTT